MALEHNIQWCVVGVVNTVDLSVKCNQCFGKVEVISLERIALFKGGSRLILKRGLDNTACKARAKFSTMSTNLVDTPPN